MANLQLAAMPPDAVQYAINHLFLPPNVPQHDDNDPASDKLLLKTTIEALESITHETDCKSCSAFQKARDALKTLDAVTGEAGVIGESCLLTVLQTFSEKRMTVLPKKMKASGSLPPAETIPLYLKAQNAAVILNILSNVVVFELFELSPCNKAVYATNGRLQRSFPISSFVIDLHVFKEPGFQSTIAQTISKLSSQKVPGLQPRVSKAQQIHDEDRDTMSPELVTEHLASFLRAFGSEDSGDPIWKNTREEVLWSQALKPWRRSPLWLLIRVTIQLEMKRNIATEEEARRLYKTFMVYLLCSVLKTACLNGVESDTIYAMQAKISRRIIKLSDERSDPCMNAVKEAIQQSSKLLEERWRQIIERDSPAIENQSLDWENIATDARVHLPELDRYLSAMFADRTKVANAQFNPASTFRHFESKELPQLDQVVQQDQPFIMAAFEEWIEKNLPRWIDRHIGDETTCGSVRKVMEAYYDIMMERYAYNPERLSIMILCLTELWIACDRSACARHKLLVDHDPGIPFDQLQNLVLPLRSQMRRLLAAETYFETRRGRSLYGYASIFQKFGETSAFSVRYFDCSLEHQKLRSQIEQSASQQRVAKLKELEKKKKKYWNLMMSIDRSACSFRAVKGTYGRYEQRHVVPCQRCAYESEAQKLSIQVHEWPLPTDPSQVKSTVFELMVPLAFGHWRDTTAWFLDKVMGCEYVPLLRPKSTYLLSTYSGLSNFLHRSGERICLASEAESHMNTHRRIKEIAKTSRDDVCVHNGLRLRYYDSVRGVVIQSHETTAKVAEMCTYSLQGDCAILNKYLLRPPRSPNGPPPNTVVANQHECPTKLSLEEFKALGTLPLGCRILWINLLHQLAMPNIDFKREETDLVLLQMIHQAGLPRDHSVERMSHAILSDEAFCEPLLALLRQHLGRMSENWESSRAVACFIHLTTRLLSLTPSSTIQRDCLSYLEEARKVTYKWLRNLREKSQGCIDWDQRQIYLAKLVELALVCINTFEVEQEYLEGLLSNSSQTSILMVSSIILQEYEPPNSDHRSFQDLMLDRWKALLYRARPLLVKEVIESKNPCLDDALAQSWSAYERGSEWEQLMRPHEQWLVTSTASNRGRIPTKVHYNLLTGELFVNGLPLSRLPAKYEQNYAYEALFGRSILEVMPSEMPGFDFSIKQQFVGHVVHLGMSSASDLLVQARVQNRVYGFLPKRLFNHHFPVAFVEDNVHWYDYDNVVIEFRSRKDPWSSLSASWRLTKLAEGWCLVKGDHEVLFGLASKTTQVLSTYIAPIVDKAHLHIALNREAQSISMELPRLRLSFSIEAGSSLIRSHQFRGMSIDPNQQIGTLIGYENKLVLKDEKAANERLVLVPEGDILYNRKADHTTVVVNKSTATKVHPYIVNRLLGRLENNGELQAKLYLCYLHGLTSYCLPDPLTGKTGTEQALMILESSAVRSFDVLSKSNIALLEQIANIAPERGFYPEHLREMQQIEWQYSLGFLAQHSGFHSSVKSLFEQAESTKMFYPASFVDLPNLKNHDPTLVERDLVRSSTYRVHGFGAENRSVQHDIPYRLRDPRAHSEKATQSFVAASLIARGKRALHKEIPKDFANVLWKHLSAFDIVEGPAQSVDAAGFNYGSRWLAEPLRILARLWCPFQAALGHPVDRPSRFQVAMWLCTIARAENVDMQLIQTLASFYNSPSMANVIAPRAAKFDLSYGKSISFGELMEDISSAHHPFDRCPEASLPIKVGEDFYDADNRRRRAFHENQYLQSRKFAEYLEHQWPRECPQQPLSSAIGTYIDIGTAMSKIRPRYEMKYKNFCFFGYLRKIEEALRSQEVQTVLVPDPTSPPSLSGKAVRKDHVTTEDIFDAVAPTLICFGPQLPSLLAHATEKNGLSNCRVDSLITELDGRSCAKHERDYVDRLRESRNALTSCAAATLSVLQDLDIMAVLDQYLYECRRYAQRLYDELEGAVTHHLDCRFPLVTTTHQRPRVTPSFFLEQLTRIRWNKLKEPWRSCILKYAIALTEMQRAERLTKVANNVQDLISELQNSSDRNLDIRKFPEYLLLEIEGGIMIREIQEQVAKYMRCPPSGKNVVMQLNMGEGKTSTIIPMVATALADGEVLVRVVVAKPQSKQTFDMLVSKLGGLLNRKVYKMPFSRELRPSQMQADRIRRLCIECTKSGGILLVQPEHIMSFKLMAVECFSTGSESVGKSILATQHFFDRNSRDIVDESDENFSVKFQLIYTMGTQMPIDFSPGRWNVIQFVLGIFARCAREVKTELPGSVEMNDDALQKFPRTRILTEEGERLVLIKLAECICTIGFSGFPIARQSENVRRAVIQYISQLELTQEEINRVEGDKEFWTDSTKKPILLLRGLIAGGILSFAFGTKRWRVNYGLDPTRKPRTRLAVPYRAKDSPAARAEFSHPDVVLVLSCLCYYYRGLTDDELFDTFCHLLKTDGASLEFAEWVRTAPHVPEKFCQVDSINLKDRPQCINEVFPLFRFSKAAIDYFLASEVFPKEMREFPFKISASGWDIGEIKNNPTTGFSGTNDSRDVLPLGVHSLDLDDQKHTNSLVLEYLLGDENTVQFISSKDPTKKWKSDAELLLATVVEMKPAVRVILDVGAQVLELSNMELSQRWLHLMQCNADTQAVVFFNDNDELSVVDRTGRVELLRTSPFSKQLDLCLVFLDEAHTRGTDLKLPRDYRAAVTLGANLTKDRLIQACMRMRKLGKGQSVTFCVPEEVRCKILRAKREGGSSNIQVKDILAWSIAETWTDLRRSVPLWASQGIRFEEQNLIWSKSRSSDGYDFSAAQADRLLEDEAQTLETCYSPNKSARSAGLSNSSTASVTMTRIVERCREFDTSPTGTMSIHEEQERELAPEIEQERQVEKAPPAQPETHTLHPDVLNFVETGELSRNSEAFCPAFETLRDSSAASHLDISQFPKDLLVTRDFARTVGKSRKGYISDYFQRSVQWIVTSMGGSKSSAVTSMVVVSPYEAERILEPAKTHQRVTVHLYAPRTNLGFSPLDTLDLYTVGKKFDRNDLPRRLVLQLNLFSGQLYLKSFDEYTDLCEFLGLAWTVAKPGVVVRSDGFIVNNDGQMGFKDSPVRFLDVLTSKIRRNCGPINKTHIGRILAGELLQENDFMPRREVE